MDGALVMTSRMTMKTKNVDDNKVMMLAAVAIILFGPCVTDSVARRFSLRFSDVITASLLTSPMPAIKVNVWS